MEPGGRVRSPAFHKGGGARPVVLRRCARRMIRARTMPSATRGGVGAGRGGAAQHAAGDGADARDRGEHRVRLVVDGFSVESMSAAGIRQIIARTRCRGPPTPRRAVPPANWLLAPPQTTRQRRPGMVASFSTAPASAPRHEHVDVLGVDFLGCRQGRAVGGGGLRAAARVKITDNQRRPRRP